MRILVIGSGGREHALVWRLAQDLAQDNETHTLFVAPGNPGMAALATRLEIDPNDHQGLLRFAQKEAIDLTIVGPEQPLADGIVDRFIAAGLTIFGPNQACAQLESSKSFAKALMDRAGVPTSGYQRFDDPMEALSSLSHKKPPYVIKEDGLAAGKGVTIAETLADAETALQRATEKSVPVVIEDFLIGEELSVLAICDGQRAIPLVSAQDFKRAGDGNTGPNTGGMGSYAPVPFVDTTLMARIQQDVLDPMMAQLQAEGLDYRGILYAGLMIAPDGTPNVVEFNARFGDPETQVVLPLLGDDLASLLLAAAQGDLSRWVENGIPIQKKAAVSVVLTSAGYPGDYASGKPIHIPTNLPGNTALFHAGTKRQPNGEIVTNGGRVLNAVGFGNTLTEAREKAYQLADIVTFEGKTLRRDIAEAAASRVPLTV